MTVRTQQFFWLGRRSRAGDGTEFFETLNGRRSVRRFSDEDVSEDDLEKVISAVMSCPTAGNMQAFRLYIFRNKDARKRLSAAAMGQSSVAASPVVLVFTAEAGLSGSKYGERGRDLYSIQDASIACTFAHLAAASLGLGSVWIGAFDEDAVSKAAGLPSGSRPVAILPIGHPAGLPGRTPRRSVDEAVKRDY